MTKLKSKIKREISLPRIRRPIIISIDPETQEISLKEKGVRQEYRISIMALYIYLVRDSG